MRSLVFVSVSLHNTNFVISAHQHRLQIFNKKSELVAKIMGFSVQKITSSLTSKYVQSLSSLLGKCATKKLPGIEDNSININFPKMFK